MGKVRKSIAIIGEGQTEKLYFNVIRSKLRYDIRVEKAEHPDTNSIAVLAEKLIREDYDYVVCLIDMDRLLRNNRERTVYNQAREKLDRIVRDMDPQPRVMFVESNPCTEMWFLLHFISGGIVRRYESYAELLPELRRYVPGYDKTIKYLRGKDLYEKLAADSNTERAIRNAESLCRRRKQDVEQNFCYSEIHEVMKLLDKIVKEK